MKLFIAAMLVSFSALARQTDNQIEVRVDKSEIKIMAKSGFHLNAEAPASASFDSLEANQNPTVKTEKLIEFKNDGTYKTAVLKFYVCDDKKTICESHEEKVNLKSGEVKASELKSNFSNSEDVSLQSANEKPTLLVFSAPWCPACVRMMTETYHKPSVEKQLGKLNFVKLNSDVTDNYALSEKFKVRAIPTLILLDKNGVETFRWLDYQPAEKFAKSVEQELKKVDKAAATLKNAKLGEPKAASELGHRAFNTMDFVEALKWFSLTKSDTDQKFKLSSEIALAQQISDEDETKSDDYLQSLQKGISLTTSKLDRIRWTIDYFDKKNEMKKLSNEAKSKGEALLKEIDSLTKNKALSAKAFNESTYGEYGGFEVVELLWMKAKLQGVLELKTDQEMTNVTSVGEIKKKNLSTSRPGEMLLAIGYLKEAGEKSLTEKLYKELVAKYPNTYVYFEKYARFSQKYKSNEQALGLVNDALKYPEGNVPQLKLLKSEILRDLNQREEAAKVVESALSAEDIQHKRYQKTYKKLKDLKMELASSK